MQLHVLSFEGPDAYSRAGGLASRVDGLTRALSDLGLETHLWFVGDPDLPGHERRGALRLHRWGQWISGHHRGGVYDGEHGKHDEYASALPPYLLREHLLPALAAGGGAVVLAEEWHTAHAVLHLDWLLREAGVRDRVALLWNANNAFGFDRVDWPRLARAATITTVSRYMKHRMWGLGVNPIVVPNGLDAEAFAPADRSACAELRARASGRTLLVKMARFDPDKCWLSTVEAVAGMKRAGWRPLLLARGGAEAHGAEVAAAIGAHGLVQVDRSCEGRGPGALLGALRGVGSADVVNLRSHVEPDARRVLFRVADAVLANSGREPFGLVGLEAMAAGGIACTGSTGEDYAVPGLNALVLETGEAGELTDLLRRLRERPLEAQAMRRAARSTARRFAWPEVLRRVLFPRLEVLGGTATGSLAPALAS